jgi:hypothetical protein
MSMNSPRYPGAYSQRATDCELAIERDFLREAIEARTPFIDLDAMLTALADDAVRAGWSEEELTEAVIALAKRHKMSNEDKLQK